MLVMESNYKTLVHSFEEVKNKVDDLEKSLREKVKNQGVESFKASLLYASDKWGTPAEKRVIKKLANKVKMEGIIKSNVSV